MYQHSAINTARLNNLKVIIILSVLLWEKKPKYCNHCGIVTVSVTVRVHAKTLRLQLTPVITLWNIEKVFATAEVRCKSTNF